MRAFLGALCQLIWTARNTFKCFYFIFPYLCSSSWTHSQSRAYAHALENTYTHAFIHMRICTCIHSNAYRCVCTHARASESKQKAPGMIHEEYIFILHTFNRFSSTPCLFASSSSLSPPVRLPFCSSPLLLRLSPSPFAPFHFLTDSRARLGMHLQGYNLHSAN